MSREHKFTEQEIVKFLYRKAFEEDCMVSCSSCAYFSENEEDCNHYNKCYAYASFNYLKDKMKEDAKPKTYTLSNGKETTSLAEKMFDDLGYGKREDNSYILYDKDKTTSVHFDKAYEAYRCSWSYDKWSIDITPPLHKAITQQLKEIEAAK